MTRVLVCVPDLSLPGGVTQLFKTLNLNALPGVVYFSINYNASRFRFLFLPLVYFSFVFKARAIDLVHLNPSMVPRSFFRDMIFCALARNFSSAKLIVYWHGWDHPFFRRLANHSLGRALFAATFAQADTQIVLGTKFALALSALSVPSSKINIESNSTPVVPFDSTVRTSDELKRLKLLFVSRIVDRKGWDIALSTMVELRNRGFFDIHLTLAGDGPHLSSALDLCNAMGLKNVSFTGAIWGEDKQALFRSSDVFIFPTCYPEGMPIVLLEAMMHGMPILTRRQGGVPDHISDESGLITESTDPSVFADYIQKLISDASMFNRIRIVNRNKALSFFSTESQIERLSNLYRQSVNSSPTHAIL
jgi:glycosyltransferase involved in cell wall biosynthesis